MMHLLLHPQKEKPVRSSSELPLRNRFHRNEINIWWTFWCYFKNCLCSLLSPICSPRDARDGELLHSFNRFREE